MNSTVLPPDQYRILAAKCSRMQAELGRLVERLYQLNVRYDDELQSLTCKALDDVQDLRMHVWVLADGPKEQDGN